MENADPRLRNDTVFWQRMQARLEVERDELEGRFTRFFVTEFAKLQPLTRPVAGAREALQTCIDRGWSVVIATNPVFPRAAIDARLAWAGVGDLPFHSVTSYENSHFTKPHVEYYAEILERLGCPPGQALRRSMKSSMSIRGRVMVLRVPRAARVVATFAIVVASGASMMFRKSLRMRRSRTPPFQRSWSVCQSFSRDVDNRHRSDSQSADRLIQTGPLSVVSVERA